MPVGTTAQPSPSQPSLACLARSSDTAWCALAGTLKWLGCYQGPLQDLHPDLVPMCARRCCSLTRLTPSSSCYLYCWVPKPSLTWPSSALTCTGRYCNLVGVTAKNPYQTYHQIQTLVNATDTATQLPTQSTSSSGSFVCRWVFQPDPLDFLF